MRARPIVSVGLDEDLFLVLTSEAQIAGVPLNQFLRRLLIERWAIQHGRRQKQLAQHRAAIFARGPRRLQPPRGSWLELKPRYWHP